MPNKSNIVLIGMPGSGKSTLGKRIAKAQGMHFVDTDTLIEKAENQSLQTVLDRRGLKYLRATEEKVISSLNVSNHVVATGGSAVYSESAIAHLQQSSVIVLLSISMQTLNRRVTNASSRGLAKMPAHPLARLYAERLPLYHAAANIVIDNNYPMSGVKLHELIKKFDAFVDDSTGDTIANAIGS